MTKELCLRNQSRQWAGEYVDNMRTVARKYMAKDFYSDLFVSIPFTWIEYIW